jgi:hypothetical protein
MPPGINVRLPTFGRTCPGQQGCRQTPLGARFEL